jgi:putative ABC transport system ATP-binding protein
MPGKKVLFEDFNFSVDEGEFVIVVGSNGAGKSTLFNLIAGSIVPQDGSVELDGVDVTRLAVHERARWISTVMQDPRAGTMDNMTIAENMSLAFTRGGRRGWAPAISRARAEFFRTQIASLQMGLEMRFNDPVRHLSGGQRQAVSLVMAVLSDFKLLLLDEVTAALDPKMSESIMEIVRRIAASRTTIMITHNMNHLRYGSRIVELADGKIR